MLLDAAALGVNIVEREGVSISHPARFLLVGTMNPEEGELRPQIADRIGLYVIADDRGHGRASRSAPPSRSVLGDPASFAPGGRRRRRRSPTAARSAPRGRGDVRRAGALYEAIAQLVLESASSATGPTSPSSSARRGSPRSRAGARSPRGTSRRRPLGLGHRPTDPFDARAGIDDRLLRRILDDVLERSGEETRKKRRARRGRGRHAVELLEAFP